MNSHCPILPSILGNDEWTNIEGFKEIGVRKFEKCNKMLDSLISNFEKYIPLLEYWKEISMTPNMFLLKIIRNFPL